MLFDSRALTILLSGNILRAFAAGGFGVLEYERKPIGENEIRIEDIPMKAGFQIWACSPAYLSVARERRLIDRGCELGRTYMD